MNRKIVSIDSQFLASIIASLPGYELSGDLTSFNSTHLVLPYSFSDLDLSDEISMNSFGIINKSKLFLREPIIGEDLIYRNVNTVNISNKKADISISTNSSKSFYLASIDNIQHKFSSSIFTNLSINNLNILFPSSEKIILISESPKIIKLYAKKLLNLNLNEDLIDNIKIPTSIKITEKEQISKIIEINNKSYVGICFQLSNLLKSNLLNSNLIISSPNQTNYIFKLFANFFTLIPSSLSSFVFKFLLRFIGVNSFSKQLLEINNLYSVENYYFTNDMDASQSPFYSNGKYFPNLKILNSNKSFNSYLEGAENLIISSKFSINTKKNIIKLTSDSVSKKNELQISQGSYDFLDLDKYCYNISQDGLINTADLLVNIKKMGRSKSEKYKYSDPKQKVIDAFKVSQFEKGIPPFRLPKLWPFKAKS